MTYEELCAENVELYGRLEKVNELLATIKDEVAIYNLNIYKTRIQQLLSRNLIYLDAFLAASTAIKELDDFIAHRVLSQYQYSVVNNIENYKLKPWYEYTPRTLPSKWRKPYSRYEEVK